ncbi:succinylglutamate desuccinylase/aspartoacylase family protein [Halomarina ordinaria]|uniref:Succinylglutamate desuccinylase/aspartoacylase family protein n=1 Tax=Halomarina ordinaria TaxID=3033939 RepID=A0ABD5UCH0_9EURY|nr:succinylglutamate desuccinylase/aspartoacylase family protein [Halomarina sp. PSRA2]
MEYEPVTHTTADRRLGRLPSGAEVGVTVHRYVGGDGPTVHVQAAQHGIELNGAAALRRLHGRLVSGTVAGTVVVVPVANPLAFDHRSYLTPAAYDALNPNLNRVWPGDDGGSLQERLAARLWELVREADAVVDLHTGTADTLEHVRFRPEAPESRALAEAFGSEYLLADRANAMEDGGGKLRAAAVRADIPAVTAELANSRTVAHSAADAGADGVWNVLRELDVLPDSPVSTPSPAVLEDDAASPRAASSGLFELRPDVSVGDRVDAGDELGAVFCPSSFERLQTVTVGSSGVLYSLAREAVVVAGERLAGVATPVEG